MQASGYGLDAASSAGDPALQLPPSSLADGGGVGGGGGPFGATAASALSHVVTPAPAPVPLRPLSRGAHWAAITGAHFLSQSAQHYQWSCNPPRFHIQNLGPMPRLRSCPRQMYKSLNYAHLEHVPQSYDHFAACCSNVGSLSMPQIMQLTSRLHASPACERRRHTAADGQPLRPARDPQPERQLPGGSERLATRPHICGVSMLVGRRGRKDADLQAPSPMRCIPGSVSLGRASCVLSMQSTSATYPVNACCTTTSLCLRRGSGSGAMSGATETLAAAAACTACSWPARGPRGSASRSRRQPLVDSWYGNARPCPPLR